MKIDTLIFDMDGVITTEEKYWACARLTLWELITRTLNLPFDCGDVLREESARESFVPDDLIYALKGRAVNSNWDIAYVMSCVYLAAIPGVHSELTTDVPTLLDSIRRTLTGPAEWPHVLVNFLADTTPLSGRPLIEAAGEHLSSTLGWNKPSWLLQPDGTLWWYLHANFQRFYHGEALEELGVPPLVDGLVLPFEKLDTTLRTLREMGYTLGVASGRPLDELNDALGHLGLLTYFDQSRLGTLEMVRETETKLGLTGLVKPHPLSLLRALYPTADAEHLMPLEFQKQARPNVLMVGDSTSDIIMANAAGCRSVGVLTGVRGKAAQAERQTLLIEAGCEAILEDVTYLPAWLAQQQN